MISFKGSLELISRGSLELGSMIEREHEALLSILTRYDMSLMEENHRHRNQS